MYGIDKLSWIMNELTITIDKNVVKMSKGKNSD